jgi:hypothetical protein
MIEPTTGDGRSWTTCPLLRIRSSPAGRLAGSHRDDHLRGLWTSTDKHAWQDLGRYQEDGIGILRALRPQPRPLQGLKGRGLGLGRFGFEAEAGLGEESGDQLGAVLDALEPVHTAPPGPFETSAAVPPARQHRRH